MVTKICLGGTSDVLNKDPVLWIFLGAIYVEKKLQNLGAKKTGFNLIILHSISPESCL